MSEADHYVKLWKGANAEGWELYRIADGSVGKKPCDIAGIAPGGLGVNLEAKLLRGDFGEYPTWQKYERHQIAWLAAYARMGGLAIAAEYSQYRRHMRLWVLTNRENFTGVWQPKYCDMLEREAGYAGWGMVLEAYKYSLPWKGPALYKPEAGHLQCPTVESWSSLGHNAGTGDPVREAVRPEAEPV